MADEESPNQAPVPVPAQAPQSNPPPITSPSPSHVRNPPGWAPGAYERFQQQGEEVRRLREAVERLQTEAAKVPELTRSNQKAAERHAMDMALVRRSHTAPNLAHPSVMRMFRSGYEGYRSDGGDQPFDQWLEMDTTKSDPLYGVHLTVPEPAQEPEVVPETNAPGQAAAAPEPTPGPNPDKGIINDDGTNAPTTYTEAQIEEIARSPRAWAKHSAEIRKQVEARYGFKIGSRGPKASEG